MDRFDSRIRVAEAASGARTYLIDLPPEALPPVRPRDLHAAWDSARAAGRLSHADTGIEPVHSS